MPIEVTISLPGGHVVASRTYLTENTIAAHAHAREWYQTDPCFEGIDPVEIEAQRIPA